MQGGLRYTFLLRALTIVSYRAKWWPSSRYNPAFADGCSAMTDDELARMHQLLAEYHRGLAKQAVLDVVQQYHSDLGQRLADEATQIPRRTAIVERLHERERQQRDGGV
jgi:hypothetical protein